MNLDKVNKPNISSQNVPNRNIPNVNVPNIPMNEEQRRKLQNVKNKSKRFRRFLSRLTGL